MSTQETVQLKDSESLDRCIQTTLSGLYPPFHATSPTVLCQVLSVVESCYRGDGLRYLIHFLLPAKQFLANLQQDACVPYRGLLFRHEGWPLCLQEKIVVQLCPLDQHLLRPGDFYLLVSPPAAVPPPRPSSRARGASSCGSAGASSSSSSPRLLLCSVSAGGRHVERREVSEVTPRPLFSMAWLDSVNRDRERRGAPRLERCVLSARGDVFRVPWEDLVYPQFVGRPRTSLTEDKMLIGGDSSGRDVELLPPPKPDRSPASSEGEESEGEYVELTELPPPLFSPQKGSLTQSISLQHRTRTGTNPAGDAPPRAPDASGLCTRITEENPNRDPCRPVVLAPASPASSSRTPQEPREGTGSGSTELKEEVEEVEEVEQGKHEVVESADEGEDTQTTEGGGERVEEEDGSEEVEEELERDGAEEVEVEVEVQVTVVQQGRGRRQEQEVTEGDERGGRGEEDERERGGEQASRDEGDDSCTNTHSEGSYFENMPQQKHSEDSYSENNRQQKPSEGSSCENTPQTRHEDSYSENISQQKFSEDSYSENNRQQKPSEGSSCENTPQTHSEDSYSENTSYQKHSEDSYSENNRLQTHSEDSYSENTPQTHSEDSYSEPTPQTCHEDSYSENISQQKFSEDSYSESNTLQTHSEDSYSENTPQTHSEDSYSETTPQTHSEDSYSETNTPQTHSEDSYSENTPQTHSEDSYSETTPQTHSEDSYSETNTPQTHSEDSYSENISQQKHSEDSYSENNRLQTHSEDSYSENSRRDKHSEDSYSENTVHQKHSEGSYFENTVHQKHSEDSYSENNTPQTHSEDSYSENSRQDKHSEDSYSENTPQTHTQTDNRQDKHSEDSYSENTVHQKHSEGSYSENTPQTHSEDSYSENISQQKCSDDSYCENTPQTHSEDCYSENTRQDKHSEGSYSENTVHQKHLEDSYCENAPQTHSEDSSSENTRQDKHSEDSYSENTSQQKHSEGSYSENIPQTHSEDFYSENNRRDKHSEDSYSENTPQTHTQTDNRQDKHSEDSYSENTVHQKHSEGSYSENTPQTHSEETYSENISQQKCSDDSYSENTPQTHSEGSYPENTVHQKHLEDSYCENTPQTHSEGSYPENTVHQKHLEDSYCENTPQTHSEDSSSENTRQDKHSEGSYSENTVHQKHSEGSYSENTVHQKHLEDSYCENTPQTHSEDSYCENSKRHTPPGVWTAAVDPDSLRTEPPESGNGREKVEQKKMEEVEEEVGGGRTAELQTEGLSGESVSLSPGPSPTDPVLRRLSQSSQSSQSRQSSFYGVLLSSGALCVPGTRDRTGRALLTVCTASSVWSNPDCDGAELLRLLLYYTSTLRKEAGASGLTVLVDARGAAPVPALFSALRSLQDSVPGSVHAVLLLVNKDSSLRLDKPAAAQVEVLSSLKSLQKLVDLRQLPVEFGGSFIFSQSSWLCFRSRVEQLTNQCEDVINLLQKTINILQSTPLPAAAQDAELLLSRYQAVMRSVLEDGRLVRLQQEGGASLSLLRREEGGVGAAEDSRAAVETVSALYDEVDELLHRLVTLSNSRTQELHYILDFRSLEQDFAQVRSWLDEVGEVRLKSLDEPEDSLELLNKTQLDFKEFQTTAQDHCQRGEALMSRLQRRGDASSADLGVYEDALRCFRARLQDFWRRVDAAGRNIERAVRLYRFLDQAYGWALEGMRQLAAINMEECALPDKCQAVIGCLEDYRRRHPPIPDGRFQEMKAAAGELRGERGLRQWTFAWSKCQETKKMFDRKMEAALGTRDSAHRRRSDSTHSRSSVSSRRTLSGLWGVHETSSSSSSLSCPPEEDTITSSPPRDSSSSSLLPITSTPSPQHTPLLRRLFRSASSDESSGRGGIGLPRLGSPSGVAPPSSSSASSTFSAFSFSRRHQLRKTQSFDCPPTPEAPRYGPRSRGALSEPVRRGNTGVFIRGLEVSSTEAADRTLCPRTGARGQAGRSPSTPGTPRTSPGTEPRPRGSKLRHVVEEMVTTEREYVRSLRYIIHHYFPEMDRADLPQDLRGKRSVVFGNLEKLLDFHSQFFLRELEACWKHPLRVPHCFLRHEQFGLYALYSKNKPKSDALLANHGNSFFRRKQVDLGDKMDLSSYLLKPVQRMSKYALLLADLMKEVGAAQEAELAALQAATDMVKFQLRHGNDLLAMDAIRDCDVNLKEQGQLIRQDEFTVWTGRRKCQRHIFLFEELVLFSKPRRVEGGLDVFIYKHSFKTADVGLTESTGDDGLRFEIWFRRRTSKNQTFILQAATSDVKHTWTSDIAQILWTQATRNKEMRLKEMVSMGVGNKPFLDIQPSDAAISDRAVHYIMKSRGARTRASIAVSVFDHSDPFKRGPLASDPPPSGPSSSSLLGPLNLHMYSQNLPPSPAAESSFMRTCLEEDEQEHETSSQPSMTTESSGSSSRCLSGSTGSDSGCVSAHLQEALSEDLSPPGTSSFSNKTHLSPRTAAVIGPATIV